jgi:hypothetical protein
MKNRKTFSLLIASLILFGLALTACTSPYQTRSDDVSGFNRISIETFGEFIIKQGDDESLTIEAPRDYLRYITSEVKNETLIISTRRGFLGGPVHQATFTIMVKNLDDISLSGAGAIKVFSLETNTLDINLTGAGSIEIDELTAERLEVNLASAGAIIIAGTVEKQEINLTGVGSFEGGDLKSKDVEIRLSGAGSAIVWAEDDLDVEITWIGSVSYFGNQNVYQDISGLGSINSNGTH